PNPLSWLKILVLRFRRIPPLQKKPGPESSSGMATTVAEGKISLSSTSKHLPSLHRSSPTANPGRIDEHTKTMQGPLPSRPLTRTYTPSRQMAEKTERVNSSTAGQERQRRSSSKRERRGASTEVEARVCCSQSTRRGSLPSAPVHAARAVLSSPVFFSSVCHPTFGNDSLGCGRALNPSPIPWPRASSPEKHRACTTSALRVAAAYISSTVRFQTRIPPPHPQLFFSSIISWYTTSTPGALAVRLLPCLPPACPPHPRSPDSPRAAGPEALVAPRAQPEADGRRGASWRASRRHKLARWRCDACGPVAMRACATSPRQALHHSLHCFRPRSSHLGKKLAQVQALKAEEAYDTSVRPPRRPPSPLPPRPPSPVPIVRAFPYTQFRTINAPHVSHDPQCSRSSCARGSGDARAGEVGLFAAQQAGAQRKFDTGYALIGSSFAGVDAGPKPSRDGHHHTSHPGLTSLAIPRPSTTLQPHPLARRRRPPAEYAPVASAPSLACAPGERRAEREFLAGCGYALFVSRRVYETWERLMRELVGARRIGAFHHCTTSAARTRTRTSRCASPLLSQCSGISYFGHAEMCTPTPQHSDGVRTHVRDVRQAQRGGSRSWSVVCMLSSTRSAAREFTLC
ncbi:hypothetical protein DFH09DRAFT_1433881, partial [Mycena vulgaris]